MTSKEALEIIETYNYWQGGADTMGNICIHPSYLKARKNYDEAKSIIEKDLEELKELKIIMGTPIQDIMKKLKVLEILKRTKLDVWNFYHNIKDFDKSTYGITDYEWYSRHYRGFSLEKLNQKEFNLMKEWLDGNIR